MPGYNVLNDELTQRVKQVVNQYMACNQLRPQPGRRARRGGGGGGSAGNDTFRLARVTTEISKATGNLVANWGHGYVKYMNLTTGEVETMEPVRVNNPLNIAFVTGALVELFGSIVRNGTCYQYPWAD